MNLFRTLILPFAILSAFSLLGCASPEKEKGAVVGPQLSESDYNEIYNRFTKSEKKYEGFHQLFDVKATLVGTELQAALLQRKSDAYLWDSNQAQEAREEAFQENSNSTKFIVVLFTPHPRLNDLAKPNSIWKTYLTVNGTRYQGEVKKIPGPFERIHSVYPSHNRFTVAYEVKFGVPVTSAEQDGMLFALTSHLGSARFEFPGR